MSTNKNLYCLFGDGDDANNTPVRSGRKHRRGRGHTPANTNRKDASAPGNSNRAAANASASSRPQNTDSSFWPDTSVGKGKSRHKHKQQARRQTSPPPQANFVTSDDWNSPVKGYNNDDTGSLTYSASSSVHSAESSNDSSFSAILKVIDSSSEGDHLIFQAAPGGMGQTQYGKMKGMGVEVDSNSAAVAGWKQRRGQQQQLGAQPLAQKAQMQPQQACKQQYSLAGGTQTEPVDLNYSKDDSSEDDVYGVEFNKQEESILETIVGKQDRDLFSAKPPATATIESSLQVLPRHDSSTPHNSAPSSPRSPGHVTPPRDARQQRTSTPPGANPLSRTSSRHSKSSSDGSFDTPAPSSPPITAAAGHAKPPHARHAPIGKSRRNSGNGGEKEEKTVEDLSEAFYAKSWMCGFADAFNF